MIDIHLISFSNTTTKHYSLPTCLHNIISTWSQLPSPITEDQAAASPERLCILLTVSAVAEAAWAKVKVVCEGPEKQTLCPRVPQSRLLTILLHGQTQGKWSGKQMQEMSFQHSAEWTPHLTNGPRKWYSKRFANVKPWDTRGQRLDNGETSTRKYCGWTIHVPTYIFNDSQVASKHVYSKIRWECCLVLTSKSHRKPFSNFPTTNITLRVPWIWK